VIWRKSERATDHITLPWIRHSQRYRKKICVKSLALCLKFANAKPNKAGLEVVAFGKAVEKTKTGG
jgi:hypothetical protein